MSRLIPGRDRFLPAGIPPAAAADPSLSDPSLSNSSLSDSSLSDRTPGDPAPSGDDHSSAFAATLTTALARNRAGAGAVHALWAAHRSAPCRRTRARLAEHYRPLVRTVAHRTAERLPGHVEPADLVQSGVFGLLEAIDRFDPDRSPRFESYAVPRIRGAVLDELRAQDWVPRSVRLRIREAERVREELAMRLRRTATDREVADALGVPPSELGAVAAAPVLSVEQLRAGADGAVLDTLACAEPDPAVAYQEQETWRLLWYAVAQLDERDRLILRSYYLEDRTLAEIGRLLGVSESRVSQLHGRLVAP
jgi:RNA polymerase sigma factor for flagellar operon FliA